MTACGESVPAVGLWEKFPVSDASLKLVARPQYVFTNVKLIETTTFTGLNPVGSDTSAATPVIADHDGAFQQDARPQSVSRSRAPS